MRLPCNKRLQTWTVRTPHPVTVDFLIPPTEETDEGGALLHIESDLAAIVTPGLELAFKDRRWKELSGRIPSGAWVTRGIPVCGPGAFTVLKALAFGKQGRKQGRLRPLPRLERSWSPRCCREPGSPPA